MSLAASLGVVVTILLASREALHHFVREKLSDEEFQDTLILAAAALVILPLVPNQGVGPFQALNPFTAWRLVVIVMVANSAGYLCQRLFGARIGLPLAGFFGGFVSSTATIAAMRSRASTAANVRPAVAGAVLSNVTTVLQLGLVVASVSTDTFAALAPSLLLGGVVASVYGAAIAARARGNTQASPILLGRPFDSRSAFGLATMVSIIMVGSTVLLNVLGETGPILAAAVGGFADAHAAAISISSLVAAGKLGPSAAVVPILVGMTANSITKIVVAFDRCSPAFSIQVAAGVALVVAAMWSGTLVTLPVRGYP